MNVVETIKDLAFFDSEYINRTQSLFHILCEQTEYHWKQGQRVRLQRDGMDFKSLQLFLETKRAACYGEQAVKMLTEPGYKVQEPSTEQFKQWTVEYEAHEKLRRHLLSSAEKAASTSGKIKAHAQSNYVTAIWQNGKKIRLDRDTMIVLTKDCPLLTIPDDVTNDWLWACQEIAEYILEIEGLIPKTRNSDMAFVDMQERQNRLIASEALARVRELKAKTLVTG